MRIEKERGEIDASKKDKQEDIDRYEYEAREELDRLIEDEQDPTMKTDTDDDEAVATAQDPKQTTSKIQCKNLHSIVLPALLLKYRLGLVVNRVPTVDLMDLLQVEDLLLLMV
jgi:hypothetical protein